MTVSKTKIKLNCAISRLKMDLKNHASVESLYDDLFSIESLSQIYEKVIETFIEVEGETGELQAELAWVQEVHKAVRKILDTSIAELVRDVDYMLEADAFKK